MSYKTLVKNHATYIIFFLGNNAYLGFKNNRCFLGNFMMCFSLISNFLIYTRQLTSFNRFWHGFESVVVKYLSNKIKKR